MGERYRSCEIHGKPFPQNMIDSEKVEMVKVYVEKKEQIEGQTVTLNLFVGNKSENEGAEACAQCLQDKFIQWLIDTGESPYWKVVQWHKETMTKKDGSGTYEKNIKTIKTTDQIQTELSIANRKGK